MFVRITADYGIEDSVERNMDSFVGGRVYASDQHGETKAAEIIAEALEGTADEYRIVDQDLFERLPEIRHRFRSDIDSEHEPMATSRNDAAIDAGTETYEEHLDHTGDDE
jgi:hypothetical protein